MPDAGCRMLDKAPRRRSGIQYPASSIGGLQDAWLYHTMISLRENGGEGDFAARVEHIFSPDGLLAKAKNFEYRPEQQRMAVAVARALEGQHHLVVEAGTGVGKSLAYLVPAVLFARERGKKAVISTYTINLQEQLIYKDIPILQKVLPVEFEAVLWKGRQNYLCPKRLERAIANATELFTGPEQEELLRIREWSLTTREGTLSDFSVEPDPAVWAQICSEQHICTARTCGGDTRCFYQQARKRLAGADVVVMNHTLFHEHGSRGGDRREGAGLYFFQ